MTPGAKAQPAESVTALAWNPKVQHILASAFAPRAVVWDLRKNEPIIKVTDAASRLKLRSVAWHPEVATQLCLASEDDMHPTIQLWDLRFASSPLNTMEAHSRGVLSLAWCKQVSSLCVLSLNGFVDC
jgi:protein transport protein SEC31